jgi:hypothetical protein
MARRLKKLIKTFQFKEENRSRVALGTDVRLNPETHRLQLKANALYEYPTTADLYAKTWLANPNTVKEWLIFQALVANELYWDGGAWSAAGPGDWSTEAEVVANIAAFPMATQSIQVIINLSTTDPKYTPEVDWVKLLYNSDLEWQEDYIAESMMPELREQLRPIAEYAEDLVAASTTVDLSVIETPYDITDVDSAYNLTSDPQKLTDIASSYDTGTKVLTLTGSQPLGERILVRFKYRPVVALMTSQDYSEFAKVPAVILDDVELFGHHSIEPGDHVIDKGTGDGYRLAHGYQADIDLQIRCIADKSKDQHRLADELKRFFATNQQLRSRGQDELFDLWLADKYGQQATPSQDELQAGRLRARIVRAVFYARDAKPVTGTKRFIATGGNLEFETP